MEEGGRRRKKEEEGGGRGRKEEGWRCVRMEEGKSEEKDRVDTMKDVGVKKKR